jgi:hypothetical protein
MFVSSLNCPVSLNMSQTRTENATFYLIRQKHCKNTIHDDIQPFKKGQ